MGGKKRKRTREGGNGLCTNEVVFTRNSKSAKEGGTPGTVPLGVYECRT